MKRFSKLIALTLALAILPVAAMATDAFGSAAVSEGQTYTLEDMLTYALQDEYMAQTEYVAIQEAFGADNPYTNIIQAELTHQAELIALFEAYGFVIPANTAAEHVQLPATPGRDLYHRRASAKSTTSPCTKPSWHRVISPAMWLLFSRS